jgi:peroxiredoxin
MNRERFPINFFLRLAVLVLAIAVGLAACTPGGGQVGNVQVGDEVPPFYLKTPDGQTVGSDDLKGKQPYVVAVFATWCPPCKTELVAFEKELWQPLKDSNIGVYGINFGDETPEQITEFGSDLGVSFPLLVDETGDFRTAVGVQGIPTSFVVGKDGRIKDIHVGFTDEGVASIKKQLVAEAEAGG